MLPIGSARWDVSSESQANVSRGVEEDSQEVLENERHPLVHVMSVPSTYYPRDRASPFNSLLCEVIPIQIND